MTSGSKYCEELSGAVGVLEPPRARRRVPASTAVSAEVEGLAIPVGGWAPVPSARERGIEGEAAGVDPSRMRPGILEPGCGMAPGGAADLGGRVAVARISRALMGRAIDGAGRPVDGRGPVWGGVTVALPRAEAGRSRSTRCTLVRNANAERGAAYLTEAARQHDGPVVALLVGGAPGSHEAFRDRLGGAAARTACVLEPGRPAPVRLRRAARVAAAMATFLARVEGKLALLVVDWRADLRAPVGVELTESVHSMWSLSGPEQGLGAGAGVAA